MPALTATMQLPPIGPRDSCGSGAWPSQQRQIASDRHSAVARMQRRRGDRGHAEDECAFDGDEEALRYPRRPRSQNRARPPCDIEPRPPAEPRDGSLSQRRAERRAAEAQEHQREDAAQMRRSGEQRRKDRRVVEEDDSPPRRPRADRRPEPLDGEDSGTMAQRRAERRANMEAEEAYLAKEKSRPRADRCAEDQSPMKRDDPLSQRRREKDDRRREDPDDEPLPPEAVGADFATMQALINRQIQAAEKEAETTCGNLPVLDDEAAERRIREERKRKREEEEKARLEARKKEREAREAARQRESEERQRQEEEEERRIAEEEQRRRQDEEQEKLKVKAASRIQAVHRGRSARARLKAQSSVEEVSPDAERAPNRTPSKTPSDGAEDLLV